MKEKLNHTSSNSCTPQIEYPCLWQYKIIGKSREDICRIVEFAAQDDPYVLTDSNVSSSGRYVSMSFEVNVVDEEHRLDLYRILAGDPSIKVVL